MQVGGTVIGEFTCDAILQMSIEYSNPNSRFALKEFPGTCLTDKQIIDYLGNGVTGYGWHISDLKIYDRPKMITQFKGMCRLKNSCFGCPDWNYQMADCNGRTITRPPQSWCYVEEVRLT